MSDTLEDLVERVAVLEKQLTELQAHKETQAKPNKNKLMTEDTGKEFEKGLCLYMNIDYIGNFKYNIEESKKIADRLNKSKLNTCYSGTFKHTAINCSRYDFTNVDEKEPMHMSAKSSKVKNGRVAPPIIGQCNPKKLCELINIDLESIYVLKKYIQNNIKYLLKIFMDYTFDCPNIYYNKSKDTIKFIKIKNEINWENYEYKWTRDYDDWNNTSTLKIKIEDKYISLMEWQFHSNSRSNMANRWFYDKLIDNFKDNFSIIDL